MQIVKSYQDLFGLLPAVAKEMSPSGSLVVV